MSERDSDLLIHRHLAGELTGEEARAFNGLVKADPAFRRRLAEMAFDEAQMRDAVTRAETEPIAFAAPPPKVSSAPPGATWTLAAAAVIFAAIGAAFIVSVYRTPTRVIEMLSRPLRTGERIEVAADAARTVDLERGARVRLAPGSIGLFHGREAGLGQSFELLKGRAAFQLPPDEERFRVSTGVASVDHAPGTGARFTLELKTIVKKGQPVPALLVVAFAGAVRVEIGGKAEALDPGSRRYYPRGLSEEEFEDEFPPGFSGAIRGFVERPGEAQVTFRVTEVAPPNEAFEDRLVGRKITVRCAKVQADEREPADHPAQKAFLRKLPKSEAVTLDVRYESGGFFLGELTPEQLKSVERKDGKRESSPERKAEKPEERKPRRDDEDN